MTHHFVRADVDGDFVTFSSDEELVEALGNINGDVFKIHVDGTSRNRTVACCATCASPSLFSIATETRGPEDQAQSQSCRNSWRQPPNGWGMCGPGRRGGGGCGPPFGGGWGFGFGGPPRWARCLQRREERRQQRRQEKEQGEPAPGQNPEEEGDPATTTKKGKKGRCGACPRDRQRRRHLRNIGEAVANVLQPFGVHVDVDVVNDDELKQMQREQQEQQRSAHEGEEEEEEQRESDTEEEEEEEQMESQEDADAAMVIYKKLVIYYLFIYLYLISRLLLLRLRSFPLLLPKLLLL